MTDNIPTYDTAEVLRNQKKFTEAAEQFAFLWKQKPIAMFGQRYAFCLRKLNYSPNFLMRERIITARVQSTSRRTPVHVDIRQWTVHRLPSIAHCLSQQHDLSLRLSQILCAFFCHYHILFQAKIAVIIYSQSWLNGKDLPGFKFLVGRIAILFP
jgi:hypothetical protein